MNAPKFSQSDYDKYDEVGKATAQDFLKSQGYTIPQNQREAYKSHDFIARKDGKDIKVEVEVCPAWIHEFPYKIRSVPCRKIDSNAELYIVVNSRGDAVMYCSMTVVKSSPKIRKDTTRSQDELFFNVPCSSFRFFSKNSFLWNEKCSSTKSRQKTHRSSVSTPEHTLKITDFFGKSSSQ
jgi:Holliday junction resolvase-like predicted endonuclease